jgi:predicted nucleotidyltransferase
MTLLQQRDAGRAATWEVDRLRARAMLREMLHALSPGTKVRVFGSVTKPGAFRPNSDVDIALASEPIGLSRFQLQGLLEETLGRPVDVVLLDECRFREKILREAEVWTT